MWTVEIEIAYSFLEEQVQSLTLKSYITSLPSLSLSLSPETLTTYICSFFLIHFHLPTKKLACDSRNGSRHPNLRFFPHTLAFALPLLFKTKLTNFDSNNPFIKQKLYFIFHVLHGVFYMCELSKVFNLYIFFKICRF